MSSLTPYIYIYKNLALCFSQAISFMINYTSLILHKIYVKMCAIVEQTNTTLVFNNLVVRKGDGMGS